MDDAFKSLGLVILPSGHLTLHDQGGALPRAIADRIRRALDDGEGAFLLHLAADELQTALPADLAYFREYAREYLTLLCHGATQEAGESLPLPSPPVQQQAMFAMRCPPMLGSENLTPEVLGRLWTELDTQVRELSAKTQGGLAAVLGARNPAWRTVGRVTFHLAENKNDPQRPFAFMATYTGRLSAAGRPQHLPLARALQEYAGAGNRQQLLNLLAPVDEAGKQSPFIKTLIELGTVYRAVTWSTREAFDFLQSLPAMEDAGLVVRTPTWWKTRRPAKPAVSVRIGENGKNALSLDGMLDFDVAVTLDGEPLSPDELQRMLADNSGLVRIRDQWVELDRDKLKEALDHWQTVQQHARENGISFQAAMRLLAGVGGNKGEVPLDEETRQWVGLSAGTWLEGVLQKLRSPEESAEAQHPQLLATLRPYQQSGVTWLRFVTQLGLGACLADDMGLGKTMQVIALLLHLRSAGISKNRTSLLAAPASLLGNWKAEIEKFAPSLRIRILHPSELDEAEMTAMQSDPAAALRDVDLAITTYGMLTRQEWLTTKVKWHLAILDEAQAIKNAGTRQARAARKLQASARIAMTGTPVENRLGDLWSLFDFLNPGLLGPAGEFAKYTKGLQSQQAPDYRPLRTLIKPYILRRLKTDRSIIADLPEKTEIKAFCSLSKRQAALYQQVVHELEDQLAEAEGIARKGVILTTLLKLKQICNHPSQWLGDGEYAPDQSGKFDRIRAICEELAQRQQKVLVFTQFREVTAPLAEYLQEVFGRPGLVLHGGTAISKRREIVEQFQREDGPPFFVLSLKAGGTGLNLTAASTVIHFDRWWNPAVENQATDRAFRIGQRQNVLVHKFVCRGTVEEKIDALIEGKTAMSREVLEGGGEFNLTELGDKELLSFLSLDINKAMES